VAVVSTRSAAAHTGVGVAAGVGAKDVAGTVVDGEALAVAGGDAPVGDTLGDCVVCGSPAVLDAPGGAGVDRAVGASPEGAPPEPGCPWNPTAAATTVAPATTSTPSPANTPLDGRFASSLTGAS